MLRQREPGPFVNSNVTSANLRVCVSQVWDLRIPSTASRRTHAPYLV